MNQSRITKYISIVILSLLVLLIAGIASAEEESFPFIGIIKGNANPRPIDPDRDCLLRNTETGYGFATHIGRIISINSEETADFCDPDNPTEGVVNGEMVIEDDDGDMLFLMYQTQAKIHPDPEFPEISFRGPFRITGGTGRFENASGRGTIAGEGSLRPPFEVVGILTGRLSLDDFDD